MERITRALAAKFARGRSPRAIRKSCSGRAERSFKSPERETVATWLNWHREETQTGFWPRDPHLFDHADLARTNPKVIKT